jgi:ABC-type Fe3+-hydroxamate transport system substrate-binding protein
VSLVPSATETLVALGVAPIACTRFCEQPGIPTVGGTKNPDVPAVLALEPDLIVMNDEENRRADYEALRDAGRVIHSMSPRSVANVGPAVAALADAVGVPVPSPFGRAEWAEWIVATRARRVRVSRGIVFVWRRPWMLLGHDTYGASLLDHVGFRLLDAGPGGRYPEANMDDIAALGAEAVLLPSEPYVFTARHRDEVVRALPDADVELVDGRDLFWWGIRTPDARERLARSARL